MTSEKKATKERDADFAEREQLKATYEVYVLDVQRAQATFDRWSRLLGDPLLASKLGEIEAGIEETKEKMVGAEKPAEIVKLQADVRARRFFVEEFRLDKFRGPLETAKDALKKFEESHPIFLPYLRGEETGKADEKPDRKSAAAGA